MINLEARERNPVRTTVGLMAAVYAAPFVVAVILHVGVEIPLGFAVLDEPRRPFAVPSRREAELGPEHHREIERVFTRWQRER
jgi:hypothetical protein